MTWSAGMIMGPRTAVSMLAGAIAGCAPVCATTLLHQRPFSGLHSQAQHGTARVVLLCL